MKQNLSMIIMSILTLTASSTAYSSSTKMPPSKEDTTKEVIREIQTDTLIRHELKVFRLEDATRFASLVAAHHMSKIAAREKTNTSDTNTGDTNTGDTNTGDTNTGDAQ